MVEVIKNTPNSVSMREMVYDTSYLVDCMLYLESKEYFFTLPDTNLYQNTDFVKFFDKCVNNYMETPTVYVRDYLLMKFNSPAWSNELVKFTHLQKLAYTIKEMFNIDLNNYLKLSIIKNPVYNHKHHKSKKQNKDKRNSLPIKLSGDRDENGRRISLDRQNAVRRISMDDKGRRTSNIPYYSKPYIMIIPLSPIISHPYYKWCGLLRNGYINYCNAYINVSKLFDCEESDLLNYKLLDLSLELICDIFVNYGCI